MPHSSVLLEGATPSMPLEQKHALVAINFNKRIAAAFRKVGNDTNAERAEVIAAERVSEYVRTYGHAPA